MDSPRNLPALRSSTIVDLLQTRAEHGGDQILYRFHDSGETDRLLTYRELDARARMIAATLQLTASAGDRVLIALGSGPDYVAALFGCMYAGMIGIPAFPARPNRWGGRLRSVASDAGVSTVITQSKHVSLLEIELGECMPALDKVIRTDGVPGDGSALKPFVSSADSIAYLQYTSGSTSDPKGVMITHENLFHNASLLNSCFGHTPESHIVSWLPLYHDMGLVGAVIQPLVGGFSSTILSPNGFIQRPIRWLEAISRYRATSSGAPNFAYDLCTRDLYRREAESLDLSCWKVACCGAETIRAETMEGFAELYRPAGFNPASFFPCYGLAESTLIVTGARRNGRHIERGYRSSALSLGKVEESDSEDRTRLVGCGAPLGDLRLAIVDPDTHHPAEAGRIGEIWVAGASVAAGYWNQPQDTESKFCATLANGEGPFLRTGDLGFLDEGELFVVGRKKEIIIIRGRNLYPQDVERTVRKSHPALDPGAGAAFGFEEAQVERLVVVHEVDRRLHANGVQSIFTAVLRAVWEEHEVEPLAIVLTRHFGVPRTSSGKIRRVLCRQKFEAGDLPIVAQWRRPNAAVRWALPFKTPELVRHRGGASCEAIRRWLIDSVAQSVGLHSSEIDPRSSFSQFGLDSIRSVQFSHELEEATGLLLPSTLFWEQPNIEALSQYLAARLSENVALEQQEV